MSSAAKPKILVTRKMPADVETRIVRDYDARLNDDDHIFSPDELIEAAQGMKAIMLTSSEKLTPEIIAALPESVIAAATFSVGYEHIDVPAARTRGLIVTNTPDVLTDATADIAMLLLLGAARRASEGERMIRSDSWKMWTTTAMCGVQVTGKRLGVLGMGRIGRAVARRARGFEMEIHYHNSRRLAPEQEAGAIYHESAEGMLREAQFLSINCPMTEATKGFLNADRIACLPDGAVVVNTARGGIVDDDALIAALRSGKLAAAGLDVYEGEPDINPAYRELENTFLMPHIGSATVETRNAMGFTCLDNLDAILAGKPPLTPVT
jgi:glyoxylate reductase